MMEILILFTLVITFTSNSFSTSANPVNNNSGKSSTVLLDWNYKNEYVHKGYIFYIQKLAMKIIHYKYTMVAYKTDNNNNDNSSNVGSSYNSSSYAQPLTFSWCDQVQVTIEPRVDVNIEFYPQEFDNHH